MTKPVENLDITVMLLDHNAEDDGVCIDLQLLNILDKTVIDGKVVGAVNIKDFATGLKEVIIKYANNYGTIDDYE
jgi:hypothetical protein